MVEFLTPGQRIKKLRKLLNMKQSDLQGSKVKRNFISMIETGTRGLTKDTACILARRFNERAGELNLNLNIDESYLLMSQEEEARQYCLIKLNENSNLDTVKTIDSIIDIAEKYNLKDVEMFAFLKKGDYYFALKDYSTALTNYARSLSSYIDKKYEAYLYNRLGLCKFNELFYVDSIELFKEAYSLAIENHDLETHKNSLYNISLCYRKLLNYEKSIKYIDEYLILCHKEMEFERYVYAKVIEANSYGDLKSYDIALEIYKCLIEEIHNKDFFLTAYVYDNLGLLYSNYEKFEQALECLDISEKIRIEIDEENLARSAINKATILVKLKNNDKALTFAIEGIEYAIKYKDYEYELKGYYLLLEIYKENSDVNNLEIIYLKILHILQNKKDYKSILEISNKLCFLYIEQNKIEKAKTILSATGDGFCWPPCR